jgi:hypothetical protein
MFTSPFSPKKFGFWSNVLQNGTKHNAKILAKRWLFFILDFDLKRLKKSKKSLKRLS